MAEHAELQYWTAEGNDLPAHEATYESFLQVVYAGSFHVINIVLALTIGAVLGHWVPAVAIIILATIVAGYSLWSGSRAASLIMVAISGLTLLYAAYS